MVNNFSDVLSKDILEAPPSRVVNFCIELELGTRPVFKAPLGVTVVLFQPIDINLDTLMTSLKGNLSPIFVFHPLCGFIES